MYVQEGQIIHHTSISSVRKTSERTQCPVDITRDSELSLKYFFARSKCYASTHVAWYHCQNKNQTCVGTPCRELRTPE